MRTLSLIDGRDTHAAQFSQPGDISIGEVMDPHKDLALDCLPSGDGSEIKWENIRSSYRGGEFFQNLSTTAIRDFHSIANLSSVSESTVLFREGEALSEVRFLLAGKVKLSVNSTDGQRLIVGSAGPGEILGLTSAILGCAFDTTAETLFPCTIASVPQDRFLKFLVYHTAAMQNLVRELSLESRRTYGQLRTLGLKLTASAKLARLLIDWCTDKLQDGSGSRISCAFTHGEIGEHIGISRETVTRTISEFKGAGLIEQRGVFLIVPDCTALAAYVGIELIQSPSRPAA